MSSVSTALALVLDGIAMSVKTSTSLKKALSYRAVEILLVDYHGKSLVSSGADLADRHQVPEVIHGVLQTHRNPVLDEHSNVILLTQLVQTVNKSLMLCMMRRFQCMKSKKIAMQGMI